MAIASNDNMPIDTDIDAWMDYASGLSVWDLTHHLEELGHSAGAIRTAIHAALMRLDIFIAVPLSYLDYDDSISRLDLVPGTTRFEGLARRFHQPHFVGPTVDGGRVVIWDIYVEETDGIEVDVDPDLAGLSYAERQRRDPNTPANCTIPYVGVLPGEAIQLAGRFDSEGLLVERSICVGPRLS